MYTSKVFKPTPPAERLVGKSPEYVASYTQTYQQKVQRQYLVASTVGCLAGNLATAFFWNWFFTKYPNYSWW